MGQQPIQPKETPITDQIPLEELLLQDKFLNLIQQVANNHPIQEEVFEGIGHEFIENTPPVERRPKRK
jgi:hypothetical protein